MIQDMQAQRLEDARWREQQHEQLMADAQRWEAEASAQRLELERMRQEEAEVQATMQREAAELIRRESEERLNG